MYLDDMTTNTDSSIRYVETYKGREVKVVHRPREEREYSSRSAGFVVYLDGKTYQGGYFPTEICARHRDADGNRVFEPTGYSHETLIKRAAKKGRQWVDASIADDEIRPYAEQVIAYIPRSDKDAAIGQVGTAVTDFEVHDRVWFYSRGNIRQGVVEKIGKTNVGVAYVTSKGGQITRMSLKPGQVGFTIENVNVIAETR